MQTKEVPRERFRCSLIELHFLFRFHFPNRALLAIGLMCMGSPYRYT